MKAIKLMDIFIRIVNKPGHAKYVINGFVWDVELKEK